MSITLVDDLTNSGANCYCSLDFANSHHTTRLHNDEWAEADDESKKAALAWATRIFETLSWSGYKDPVLCTGPLRFPRVNIVDRDGILHDTVWTPDDIKKGVAEMALFLLREDRTEGFDTIQADTNQLGSVGERKLRYNKYPPAVMDYIGHYLGGNSFQVRVVRV